MQHEHFNELKEWSERKHELVIKYLKGFVKILGGSTKGIVYYVDGFAGPGIYDDGAKGSPIRAANYANTLIGKHYQLRCINVEADQDCFDNLDKNTSQYGDVAINHCGAFEDYIDQILVLIEDRPAIFFIDPFGLKGIEWEHLYPVLKRHHKTELLLRINPQDISRLAGFSDSEAPGAEKKRQVLTDLYGFSDSDIWIQVWEQDGTDGLIKLYLDRIQNAMCRKNNQSYVYTYSIKTIEGRLKYYLIFATRHPKGAILMSNIIYGREKDYERDVKEYEQERLSRQSAIQLSMLDELIPPPTEKEIFDSSVEKLKEDIWKKFEGKTASRIDVHNAMLSKWFGRIKGPHLTRAFKELERENKIVDRSGARSNDYAKFTFRSIL